MGEGDWSALPGCRHLAGFDTVTEGDLRKETDWRELLVLLETREPLGADSPSYFPCGSFV